MRNGAGVIERYRDWLPVTGATPPTGTMNMTNPPIRSCANG